MSNYDKHLDKQEEVLQEALFYLGVIRTKAVLDHAEKIGTTIVKYNPVLGMFYFNDGEAYSTSYLTT
jgi:hypothetical protein